MSMLPLLEVIELTKEILEVLKRATSRIQELEETVLTLEGQLSEKKAELINIQERYSASIAGYEEARFEEESGEESDEEDDAEGKETEE